MRLEIRDTELPDVEDRIPQHSLVLTQYRSVTMDGQTDGFAVPYTAACKASFVAHCKK